MESEEARKARLEKERSAQGRTLWEQLEDQKAKKKEEYDAVTKQIFGTRVFDIDRCPMDDDDDGAMPISCMPDRT